MRAKVAKKLRRLTRHLDQATKYNTDHKPVIYTPVKNADGLTITFNRTRGIPLTMVETCARAGYKRLKTQYNAR